ncbi:helix-turn-helix domain-containing protein [Serinicoccus marinus]|uniref:helix-turn-helix domain-containing protein n=1 Tax=Serinicoccus marinus TaxID=247333 RepID=UPI00122E40D6|nr:helix-turn-helix domain-containing protein [Serinicoccus marinus]
MAYTFTESASPLVSVLWWVEVEEDATYTDAANEFWGIAFSRRHGHTDVVATLIGPSTQPRTLDLRAGERGWGVELPAHVFLRHVPKLSLLGEMRDLPCDGAFVEIGGVRLPVPGYADTRALEEMVTLLHRQGVLVTDEAIAAALAGDAPAYSDRQLRRRSSAAAGMGPKQLQQLARVRAAYRLLHAGRTLAEAAVEAGYSDQAHMTRGMRAVAGTSPARILAADLDSFGSRPGEDGRIVSIARNPAGGRVEA